MSFPDDKATVTQGGRTTTFIGLAVLRKDFVAYHLIGIPDLGSNGFGLDTNFNVGPSTDPLLAFGGEGFDFGTNRERPMLSR